MVADLGPLLDWQPPAVVGSATSEAAARHIKKKAPSLKAKVLAFIEAQGELGATDLEMQAALGLSGDTQRARRWTLEKEGRIRRNGATRKTRAGLDADVWVVAR